MLQIIGNQPLQRLMVGAVLIGLMIQSGAEAQSNDLGGALMSESSLKIYSPAPSQSMLHEHNLELGRLIGECSLVDTVEVVPVALPQSINDINAMDPAAKGYQLPIVTTLDFKTAIDGGAPDWHSYATRNTDLKFVASLYNVAFGLLAIDSSITSYADLKGKRVAVPPRPSAVRWFTESLLQDGWGILEDVILVEMIPPEVPGAIANNEVDVVAWNIMSETPKGYLPLLPMIFETSSHWIDLDSSTLEKINKANVFKTELTRLALDSVVGMNGGQGRSVNLLSFRQALAAWESTPDELVTEILECLSRSDIPFGSQAAFSSRVLRWPDLSESDIHSGVFDYLNKQ